MWRLDGKRALVTGGTRGIGRAVVEELLDLGATVTIVARTIDPTDRVTGIAADVTVAADRARIVAAIKDPLHILVHNAGGNIRGALSTYDDATIEHLVQLNLIAPVALSRDLYPALRAASGASVIHVGSVAGTVALTSGVPYAMAKAGLAQVARTLALEWGPDNIRVNTVAPWYTRTPLAAPILSRPDALAAIIARTPLGRIAEPREVATVIAFLALPASSYVTGQHLAVDGGMTAQGLRL